MGRFWSRTQRRRPDRFLHARNRFERARLTSSPGQPKSTLRAKDLPEPAEGIVEVVDDAFLERDDGVVGDGDVLGTDLGAALGDVAIADAVRLFQLGDTVLGIERMHLERGGVNEV